MRNESTAMLELELLTGVRQPLPLVLHLFKNDWTPGPGDSLRAYREVEGGGYKAVTLESDQWRLSAGMGLREATTTPVTFTFSGAVGRVYGYFVTYGPTGEVVASDRFRDGPYDVVIPGSSIQVTVLLTKKL